MTSKPVYIAQNNIVSPLGFTTGENMDALAAGRSGIRLVEDAALSPVPVFASVIDHVALLKAAADCGLPASIIRIETLLLLAAWPVLQQAGMRPDARMGFILSTTKGDIGALQTSCSNIEAALPTTTAHHVARHLGFTAAPVVVCNACVSGLLAISVARTMIRSGRYDHVLVVGADEVTAFVLAGFRSFQAIADEPCRPFSANRAGVTLGEAAAAALITSDSTHAIAEILGDGSANDANHISGPSRTAEGLFYSVAGALREAGIDASAIDYISAHGTATLYNDEMEAVAFDRLGLTGAPVNSLKGSFGHTLGAAGLLEAIIAATAAQHNMLLPTVGFETLGVTKPLNVIQSYSDGHGINTFLKTASGFGGCNAAMIFRKTDRHGPA